MQCCSADLSGRARLSDKDMNTTLMELSCEAGAKMSLVQAESEEVCSKTEEFVCRHSHG